jgi:predicted nicotinamide N-methyase
MNVPPQTREIYLAPDKLISLQDQVFFQTGDDGVHIWESSIVLSRYLLSLNPSCSVLELGSGSGLAGLAVSKFTSASPITLTDYNQRVLSTLRNNLIANNAVAQAVFLDWRDPSTYTAPADLVVGSDLIYDGAPIADLVRTILAHMTPNAKCCIVMPDKRKMTPVFLQTAEKMGLSWTVEELKDWFTSSPHVDEARGFREFAELTMRKYMLYTLTR